jgi:TonB-linked SusC/RagA family outer membrane protein
MNQFYHPFLRCLLLILLALPYSGYAQLKSPQQTRAKVNVKGISLGAVLKDIENQTGYQFSYDEAKLNITERITINSSSSLDALLKGLTEKFGLEFKVEGGYIAVRKSAASLRPFRMITGVVTDEGSGNPVPGVNVYKKGTRQAVVTNSQGEFTFKLNGDQMDETVLVFSYIGMKNKEIQPGRQTYLRVSLENDVFGMNEVVVTGSYTTDKRREEVVGSISSVSAKALQVDRPIESLDKLLEGLVAGVQVETTTELNTPVKINIRGMGSLPTIGSSRTTSSQPLYVVDGVPVYEQQRGNESGEFNNEGYLNPLSNINPDDIKSISILKDATASGLYGANAANGVVIITTKSGDAGKTRFNFSYDTGVNTFINKFNWLSGPEYYSLLRETYINGGMSSTLASQTAGSRTVDTDWLDLTTRNAIYQNAGLDISGGSDKTTFRFSTGYRNQQASSVGNDLKKFYLRLNVDHKVSDKFRIGFSLSPNLTNSNTMSSYGSVIMPPNLPPYTDGTYSQFLGLPNPLAVIAQNENSNKGLQLMARTNASYKLTPEITLSGTLGAESYQNKQTQFQSGLNATGANVNGRLNIYDRNYQSLIGFFQATYDKTFNKHTFNFLIGTQVEDAETNLLRGTGTGFTFDRLRTLSSAALGGSASSKSSNATVSYYSQLGYDFDKKYFATFNLRADKSSIFGGDKQVALNGSAGVGYIMSKEDFLKDNNTLTFLRLRTTYGATGNSRIGNYSARGLYSFGSGSGSTYNGNIISTPDGSAAPNPDLGWERNMKLNFGLDFTLFNKFQVTAEYYSNTVHNLISSVYVPLETGFSQISANTSKMRNNGFEFTLNANAIERKNFSWNIAWNIGTSKNTLLEYNNDLGSVYGMAETGMGFKVGNSVNAIYGYQRAGVNPATGQEQFYGPEGSLLSAREVNALPLSSTTVLGNRLPDFQGGLVNSFSYKDFSLSFNIIYSYGASQLFNIADESDGRNFHNRNQSADLLDRWQRPGDVTDIPQLMVTRSVVTNSSRFVYDVSYFKLSNVALNYQLPEKVASKLHMSRASIFTNATNLFYVYKDQGTKGRNGVAERRFVYPETMAFIAGIKLGF